MILIILVLSLMHWLSFMTKWTSDNFDHNLTVHLKPKILKWVIQKWLNSSLICLRLINSFILKFWMIIIIPKRWSAWLGEMTKRFMRQLIPVCWRMICLKKPCQNLLKLMILSAVRSCWVIWALICWQLVSIVVWPNICCQLLKIITFRPLQDFTQIYL